MGASVLPFSKHPFSFGSVPPHLIFVYAVFWLIVQPEAQSSRGRLLLCGLRE